MTVTPMKHSLAITRSDFCQLFERELPRLHLLCFLLTANSALSERCLMSALDECLDGIAVAERWPLSWAKRVVVKTALGLVGPNLEVRAGVSHQLLFTDGMSPHLLNPAMLNIFRLEGLDRAVFVLCVLEGYSEGDSASLLRRSLKEIREARIRAITCVSEAHQPI